MPGFFVGCIPLSFSQQAQPGEAGKRSLISSYENKLVPKHLLFLENRGQVTDETGQLRPDVLFTAKNKAVKMFITGNGIQYQFTRTIFPNDDKVQRTVISRKKRQIKQGNKSVHSFSVHSIAGCQCASDRGNGKAENVYGEFLFGPLPEWYHRGKEF